MQNVRTKPTTVTQLAELADTYAMRTFREPGTRKLTRHHYNWRDAMRPLVELFPLQDPATLEAPHFQEAQDWWVDLGTCNRKTINDRMKCMRSVLKWAAKKVRAYIPKTVMLEAEEVEDLQPGQTCVPEPGERRIATRPQINTVMAFASTLYLTQMVEIHALTGMRSSELVKMRRSWLKPMPGATGLMMYEPATHKTRRFGKKRQVVIGPKAVGVLLDHLRRLPADQDLLWPITTSGAYYQAIQRSCQRAQMSEAITALMIRRYAGYTIRREEGLDAAQQALGHSNAATTELYAPPDLGKLIEAMKRHG